MVRTLIQYLTLDLCRFRHLRSPKRNILGRECKRYLISPHRLSAILRHPESLSSAVEARIWKQTNREKGVTRTAGGRVRGMDHALTSLMLLWC